MNHFDRNLQDLFYRYLKKASLHNINKAVDTMAIRTMSVDHDNEMSDALEKALEFALYIEENLAYTPKENEFTEDLAIEYIQECLNQELPSIDLIYPLHWLIINGGRDTKEKLEVVFYYTVEEGEGIDEMFYYKFIA